MKKNVAGQAIGAQLVNSTDGSAVTSGTTTVYRTGDNGTQASIGTATHKGQGYWSIALSQANTNYDHIAFTFVNSNAVDATVQVFTSFPQSQDHTTDIGSLVTDVGNLNDISAADVRTELSTELARIDVNLSTRLATSTYEAPNNALLLEMFNSLIGTTGTSTASSGNTLTLEASETTNENFWRGQLLAITSGVGAGQVRLISQYSTGRVATVTPSWDTTPDAASGYAILTNGPANVTAWRDSQPLSLIDQAVPANVRAWDDNATIPDMALQSDVTDIRNDIAGLNDLSSADVTAAVPTTAEIEAAIINEGDGTAVLQAILDKINNDLDISGTELAAIAGAVRTELSTELARIDVAISTRLATAGYTSPANSDILAIKGKTDNLIFTKANELDVNIQSVNDVTVTGTGANGDEWGP